MEEEEGGEEVEEEEEVEGEKKKDGKRIDTRVTIPLGSFLFLSHPHQ